MAAPHIEIGEKVPNLCYQDAAQRSVCLDDAKTTVRVLIYNAGYLGACNAEMGELVPKVTEFEAKPVTFYSLSIGGWSSGELPDAPFLKEWKEKFDIPFHVAASPNNPGKEFFPSARIPSAVVIDKEGKLAFRQIHATVDQVLGEVRRLLN